MKDIRSTKFAILKVINSSAKSKVHKYNLIGRANYRGKLESFLNVDFSSSDRALVDKAFEELKKNELIEPTYDDVIEPDNWIKLTDKGSLAIETRALDDLDILLSRLDNNLITIREGAWSALDSSDPDSLRQSAHSARELIDQLLKIGSPDIEVKKQDWYQPDNSSHSKVTRRHRIKYLVKQYKGDLSKSDLTIVEKYIDLLIAIDDKLQSIAHTREKINFEDVKSAIDSAEKTLLKILI